jgi:hypothetical protein
VTVPPIPKRRRLYSLEPMNVGTVEVESLTGYVARIADAHCVTVNDLVGAKYWPQGIARLSERYRQGLRERPGGANDPK